MIDEIPELEPAFYDLSESDMDIPFSATNTYFSTAEHMTLREIVQALRETYCGSIGAEYMHVTEPVEKRWWQERLESIRSKPSFSAEVKKHILDRLTAAGRGGPVKSNASSRSPATRSRVASGRSPWTRSIKRRTEENSSGAESTKPRLAHGEITMAGTRGPRPNRSTWGGATWS